MTTLKNIITGFIPPVAVTTCRKIMHIIDSSSRDSPFKYLPKDINPKWIMDIGANEGHVSISAMNAFPNANIICFEPVSETFKILQTNLDPYRKAKHNRKILLRKLAISDFIGKAEINITNFSPANSILPLYQTKIYTNYNPEIEEIRRDTIDVTTLDNLISNNKLPSEHFDIVKIDVEGLEWSVLRGGVYFFQNCVDIIIIELSFQRETDPECPSYLRVFNDLDLWGFKLINIYDVDNVTYDNPRVMNNTMITQMDCVFRKKK